MRLRSQLVFVLILAAAGSAPAHEIGTTHVRAELMANHTVRIDVTTWP